MKTTKQVLSLVFSSLLVVVMALTGMSSLKVDASTTVSWNFKNSSFKDLGTISSTTTVDGLTLVATDSLTMQVKAKNATVSGTDYTYALALSGRGSQIGRAVKVPVSGNDVIKVTLQSSSSTEARTLIVADSSGNQLTTMSADTTASTQSYTYTGGDSAVWLYSQDSGIDIFKIQVDSYGTEASSSSSSTGSTSSSSTSTNTSDGAVVTSYSELVSAISQAENAGGGKIYVTGTSIDCSGQIALSKSSANVQIIGVQNSDGTYPELDFSSFMSSYIGKASSDSAVGIRITGSNYTLQNLIVEHAPDNGIQIKGTSAGNNTVSNCITRYNNDAGLQVTAGAYQNTIESVYSYRNCDVYTRGGNADGFAPKLGAGSGNTFTYCYAWDNSDDGWDSYDKSGDVTPDISYTYCAVWNNGNPDVFTGKYDFDNGNALDENLLLVQLIEAQDSSFATNYANGQFSLPTSNFIQTDSGTISVSSWAGSSYDGNPNGFKLGSAYSTSSATRTLSYCLAFDESKKGFDNNNSSVTGYFNNCIAFDNGYNYYIQPLTITGWSSVYGFNGSSSDKLPSGYSVTTPSTSTQSSIRSTVESTKNSIISSCQANKIPGKVTFNIF